MALDIVWRNPNPPATTERRVEPIAADDFCALYAVHVANKTTTFKVTMGRAA